MITLRDCVKIDTEVDKSLEKLKLLVPEIPKSHPDALYELRQSLGQVFDNWERIRCEVENYETFANISHLCDVADSMLAFIDHVFLTRFDPPSSVHTDLD